ncbi:hypothetical protein J6590_067712 [Homalodisca vitripennis]|nr:hypothetical protein J6590_067712 [Homalodisca vitripennis]
MFLFLLLQLISHKIRSTILALHTDLPYVLTVGSIAVISPDHITVILILESRSLSSTPGRRSKTNWTKFNNYLADRPLHVSEIPSAYDLDQCVSSLQAVVANSTSPGGPVLIIFGDYLNSFKKKCGYAKDLLDILDGYGRFPFPLASTSHGRTIVGWTTSRYLGIVLTGGSRQRLLQPVESRLAGRLSYLLLHFFAGLRRLPPPPSCSLHLDRTAIHPLYASSLTAIPRKQLESFQYKAVRFLNGTPWFVRNTIMMRSIGIPMLGYYIKTQAWHLVESADTSDWGHIFPLGPYSTVKPETPQGIV